MTSEVFIISSVRNMEKCITECCQSYLNYFSCSPEFCVDCYNLVESSAAKVLMEGIFLWNVGWWLPNFDYFPTLAWCHPPPHPQESVPHYFRGSSDPLECSVLGGLRKAERFIPWMELCIFWCACSFN